MNGVAAEVDVNITSTWLPSIALTPSISPLYGTCSRSMPADCLNSSASRCGALPLPDDAIEILPGCDFASFTSSAKLLAGKVALEASVHDEIAARLTGAKAFCGS